jgi:predicted aldo/keto reductase-like oxidoreductase
MPCPKGVDIPGMFAAYNLRYSEGKFSGLREHFMCSAARRDSTAAYNCIGCGKCESHCPQHIPIRQELKNASKELEGPIYRGARKLVEVFKLYG